MGKGSNKEWNKNIHGIKQKENTTQQNLWDTLKAVLGGIFTALSTHIRKT